MHDLLFEDRTRLPEVRLKTTASELGLDRQAFDECLDSGRYVAQIDRDLAAAAAAGISGTPALFVNGRLVYGVVTFEKLSTILDTEFERAGLEPPKIEAPEATAL